MAFRAYKVFGTFEKWTDGAKRGGSDIKRIRSRHCKQLKRSSLIRKHSYEHHHCVECDEQTHTIGS